MPSGDLLMPESGIGLSLELTLTPRTTLWPLPKIGGDYRVFPYRNTWPEATRELALDADALIGSVLAFGAIASVPTEPVHMEPS